MQKSSCLLHMHPSVPKVTSSQLSPSVSIFQHDKPRHCLPLFQYNLGLELVMQQGVRGDLTFFLVSLMGAYPAELLQLLCAAPTQTLAQHTPPAGKEPISPAPVLVGGYRQECAGEKCKPVLQPSAAWKEQSVHPESNQVVSIKLEENRKLLPLIKGLWFDPNHKEFWFLILLFICDGKSATN